MTGNCPTPTQSMKSVVLQKTKYILANSWFGLLLPAGVHQLLNIPEKAMISEKPQNSFRAHPAESRISRTPASKARP